MASKTPPLNSPTPNTTAELQALSRFLDSSIRLPGGYRIGWDGIIGLIPGLGDVVGACISLYIIIRAKRLGGSNLTIMRMLLNVAIELIVGLIPVVGDIFDFVFKSNTRNLALLNKQLVDTPQLQRSNTMWLALWSVSIIALFGFIFYACIWLLGAIWNVIF